MTLRRDSQADAERERQLRCGTPALILVCVLALAAVPLLLGSTPVASAYTPHAPIAIHGDADFTAANGVTGGSGTPVDPYVLSGWDIDAGPATGIWVNNTRAPFVVRDVFVHGGTGSYDLGILLQYVASAQVVNSTLAGTWMGIEADGAPGVSVLNNTLAGITDGIALGSSPGADIRGNVIDNATEWAISVAFSNGSTVADNLVRRASPAAWPSNGVRVYLSSDVVVTGNRVSDHWEGIEVESADRVRVEGNSLRDNEDGVRLYGSTNATITNNTFAADGIVLRGTELEHFRSHNIDPTNVVSGNPVRFYRDCDGFDIDGLPTGQIILANCTAPRITNLAITGTDLALQMFFVKDANVSGNRFTANPGGGAWIEYSLNASLTANNLSGNGYGAVLSYSSGVVLARNNVSSNRYGGLYIESSSGTRVVSNNLSGNPQGIEVYTSPATRLARNLIAEGSLAIDFYQSDRGMIVVNDIRDNHQGISAQGSPGTRAFHNNFVNNTIAGWEWVSPDGGVAWNETYPNGGNYWSNYAGVDLFSGPNQDIPGPDGMGDVPFAFPNDSRDHYPLMTPYVSRNEAPIASFTASPPVGYNTTDFTMDATSSFDPEDSDPALEVRWDWEDDGAWDTGWSTARVAQHRYPALGTYRIRLEVRDTTGLTDQAMQTVDVVAPPLLGSDYIPWRPLPAAIVKAGLSTQVSLSLQVKNIGNGTAPIASTLALFNVTTPGTPFATFAVPPLAPAGMSQRFAATWTPTPTAGRYYVVASVDYGDNLTEWNELNNQFTWTIDVVPGVSTVLVVGQPRADPGTGVTYVTSSTLLRFEVFDPYYTGVRRTMYRVDNGPWVNYTATGAFWLSTEGEHTLRWYSEDWAGNVENVTTQVLRVDNTPPSVGLALGDPKYLLGGTFITSLTPIRLLGPDGGTTPAGIAQIEYRIDAGAWQTYVGGFYVASAGNHALEYRAQDLLGNAQPVQRAVITVDDAPPTLSLRVGTPSFTRGGTFITSATLIAIDAEDGGLVPVGLDRVEFRTWNGTWTPWTSYWGPFTFAGDGERYLEYRGRDLLGNEAGEHFTTFFVDDLPPTTAISIGYPNAVDGRTFITPATPIALGASDGGAIPVGVGLTEYRIDGGPWVAYSGPFGIGGEGSHTLEYRSVDQLGNAEPVRTVALTVDATPPATTLDVGLPRFAGPAIFVTSATEVRLSAVDPGALPSGLATTEYRLNGGPWTPYAGAITLTGTDGLRTLEYRSRDRLGNAEAVGSVPISLDNTPPTTSISPAAATVPSDTVFTVAASDGGSGVGSTRVRIDGGPWADYAGGFRLPVGEHEIAYRSIDNLGTVEEERVWVVTILPSPPPPVPQEPNAKPAIAGVFALLIALMGAWDGSRRPWGRRWRRPAFAKFAISTLPFVVAEVATGVGSALTGALAIPRDAVLGLSVDLAILAAGIAVPLLSPLPGRGRPR